MHLGKGPLIHSQEKIKVGEKWYEGRKDTAMLIGHGRDPRPCGFCGESSWAGRMDLEGNFLCEPCVKKAEKLLAEARRLPQKGQA